MRIVFVGDTVEPGNGLAASLRRQAAALRQRGHEVRVVTTNGPHGHPDAGWIDAAAPNPLDRFPVAARHVPVVDTFARPQHFTFADGDVTTLRRALDGADVLHVWNARRLGTAALDVASQHGIPASAGFHIQPENITWNVGVGGIGAANDLVHARLRRFYDRVGHVHCPSRFIAGELTDHGYRAELHVISNGVTDEFVPDPTRAAWSADDDRRFRVVTVGRLSAEKSQQLLLRAVARSRHRERIEVQVCGRGPLAKPLRALGGLLPNRPRFGWFHTPELVRELQRSDLYVHPADVEIESISCLEAVACGLVPVISDSHASAAGQFALDDRSLFRAGSARALAQRIDWWFEHPDELAAMGPRYADSAVPRRMGGVAAHFERMLLDAIHDGPPRPGGHPGR